MLLGLGCKHVIALTDLGVRIDAQRGQNPNILLQLKRTKVRPPDAVTFLGRSRSPLRAKQPMP